MWQFFFYLSSFLFLKKVPFGTIYIKDSYLLIYSYIAPGNFSLLAQRKVAEKESALKSCRKRKCLGS